MKRIMHIADMERMALTRDEVCMLCNISLPTLDIFLQRESDPIPHIRLGRKVIIPLNGLKEWLRKEAERQYLEGLGEEGETDG